MYTYTSTATCLSTWLYGSRKYTPYTTATSCVIRKFVRKSRLKSTLITHGSVRDESPDSQCQHAPCHVVLRRNIVGRRVKALYLHWLQQASQFLRSTSRRILLHMPGPRSARYMFAESHARESLDDTELHCKHDTIPLCSALTSSVFFLSTNADTRLLAGGGLCGKNTWYGIRLQSPAFHLATRQLTLEISYKVAVREVRRTNGAGVSVPLRQISPRNLDNPRLSEHLILGKPMKGHPIRPSRGGAINDSAAGHSCNRIEAAPAAKQSEKDALSCSVTASASTTKTSSLPGAGRIVKIAYIPKTAYRMHLGPSPFESAPQTLPDTKLSFLGELPHHPS